jgi:hypothetical protein
MSHKCFISFKKEDNYYKDKILERLGIERIKGKALDKWIDSDDLDYVMQVIRREYLSNTSVTLYLIGSNSSENEGLDYRGYNKQNYMIKELQATLFNRKSNRRSGLLGIVLPHVEQKIYSGTEYCENCGTTHNIVNINDTTTLREFSQNYYLKPIENGCFNAYEEEGRYCVLVRYSDFMTSPNEFIDFAFEKTLKPIANHVHWRDIKHKGN